MQSVDVSMEKRGMGDNFTASFVGELGKKNDLSDVLQVVRGESVGILESSQERLLRGGGGVCSTLSFNI